MKFNYGTQWDLAFYLGDNRWISVPYLPGISGGFWTLVGYFLQSGGIQQYRQEWNWRFGELPPGRYMFIRDGLLGDGRPNYLNRTYVLVEFYITEDSPVYLPPQSNEELTNMINLVEYGNVTPNGMSIVVENVSIYDIDHRAQILAIVPEGYTQSGSWFEWQFYGIPFLPVENYCWDRIMQGEGFLPSGGQLEFSLDWTTVVGELSPGEYRIVLSPGGRAHPPHPTGWVYSETTVISFTI